MKSIFHLLHYHTDATSSEIRKPEKTHESYARQPYRIQEMRREGVREREHFVAKLIDIQQCRLMSARSGPRK